MVKRFVLVMLVMGMIAAISIIPGCDVPKEPESSSGGGGGGGDGGGGTNGGYVTVTFTVTVRSNQSPNSPIQGATVALYATDDYAGSSSHDYSYRTSSTSGSDGNASVSYSGYFHANDATYNYAYVKANISAVGFRSASTTSRKVTYTSPSTSETVYLAPE